MSDPITVTYPIDQAAALRAGRVCPATRSLPLDADTLGLCTEQDRAFLAHQMHDGALDLRKVWGSFHALPSADRELNPGAELAAHIGACSQTYRAYTARLAADAAERQAEREQQEAEAAAAREARAATDAREQALLASALVAPVASVLGFLADADLYGTASAPYVARGGVRAWLASASADLATYWDRHGDRMDLGKAAMETLARHVEGLRAERAAMRTQWVTDLVTFFGDDNARERRAAGVLPRADVDALAWAAIQAPDGNEDAWNCPRCGDENAEPDEAEGKPVSAAVWAAAQALAGALQVDVLETLGLAVTRDIVLVTYDCPSCEPSHRFELKLTLEHPANGWCTHRPRYYPLEEV